MAVLDALKRFGIPIREPNHHHGRPSQPQFGKKFRKNVLIKHAAEQRVIDIINALRERGLSLREIAKILGDKQHGQRWHPEMVRRILLRGAPADS